jgi:hypothetical protein
MPSLFIYILAAVLVLGGGYAGLHWLEEPTFVESPAVKEYLKSREVAEHARGKVAAQPRLYADQARPYADLDQRQSYELGSGASPARLKSDLAPVISEPAFTVPAVKAPPVKASPVTAPAVTAPAADPSAISDGTRNTQGRNDSPPAKDAANVPRGGCMPFGITENGELVFPMECQAILTQNGAGHAAPQPDSIDPAAKQRTN